MKLLHKILCFFNRHDWEYEKYIRKCRWCFVRERLMGTKPWEIEKFEWRREKYEKT